MTTATSTVEALTDISTGQWLVSTAASQYAIDLDARTIRRIPGGGGTEEGFHVARWGRDEDAMTLGTLIGCEVGYPLVATVIDPDVMWLKSTVVRRIEMAEEGMR